MTAIQKSLRNTYDHTEHLRDEEWTLRTQISKRMKRFGRVTKKTAELMLVHAGLLEAISDNEMKMIVLEQQNGTFHIRGRAA